MPEKNVQPTDQKIEQALKRLHIDLRDANALYTLDRRMGTQSAVMAVVNLIHALPPLNDERLDRPLVRLCEALFALEDGTSTPDLFLPNRTNQVGAAGYDYSAQLLKVVAVCCVDRLNHPPPGKVDLTEAYSLVWRRVKKYEDVLARKSSDVNPVPNWRKELAADVAGPASDDRSYAVKLYRYFNSLDGGEPPKSDKQARIADEMKNLERALSDTFGELSKKRIGDNYA